jgi:hypothetical protein
VSEPTKVLWKANASRSDWRSGEPLRRLVGAAARLGLLGRPQRIEPEPAEPEKLLRAQPGDELAAAILAAARAQGRTAELTLSGDDPAPWELFWNVYPFDAEEDWVDGLNTLWLTFDRSRVPDRAASDALLAAFFAVHSAADTEYAVLHPYDHWSVFDDRHYGVPVTINLMFKGVFWANFLGPGHLEEFDPARLADLDAYEVRWLDAKGLFVVATPDLASADAPASEPVLLRLTQRFRRALRPDSRWA